jgi:hypothetical protein
MPDLKDSVVKLYVKRFIIPRALIFDKPGFVDFKISGKTNVLLRQILFPESFFILLEKKLVDEFGNEGEKALYSIGKRFGYSFAQNGRFENIKDHPGKKIVDWVVVASKFVEGTYASNISQNIDIDNKIVDYDLTNFVVCRKLGFDFFLATAGAAGIIAWLFQDPNIEGTMYDSKFENGNHVCKVKCAPLETLNKEFSKKVYSEKNLDDLGQDMVAYQSFNKEVDIGYTKSFQTFLDSKIFSYSDGIISYKEKDRFFLMEVSGMYLIEKGMINEKMKKIMFDCAVSSGKELFTEFATKDLSTMMELLSALGWGKVFILSSGEKLKVIIKHFPWSKYYKDIDFLIIGGLISGIFSRAHNKNIVFNKPNIDISEGNLSLLFQSGE